MITSLIIAVIALTCLLVKSQYNEAKLRYERNWWKSKADLLQDDIKKLKDNNTFKLG